MITVISCSILLFGYCIGVSQASEIDMLVLYILSRGFGAAVTISVIGSCIEILAIPALIEKWKRDRLRKLSPFFRNSYYYDSIDHCCRLWKSLLKVLVCLLTLFCASYYASKTAYVLTGITI